MMTFIGEFALLELDEKAFKKNLDYTIKTQIKQAARAWLRAVIPRVPVFTGTARGSLQPLGRFLRVAVPISPVANRENRGPSVGRENSSFVFHRDGPYLHTFEWNTEVVHFIINEYNNMSGILPLKNPTPWHAIKAGETAFNKYAEDTASKSLPKLEDYIRARTLRVK